jgi:hypothetical protein
MMEAVSASDTWISFYQTTCAALQKTSSYSSLWEVEISRGFVASVWKPYELSKFHINKGRKVTSIVQKAERSCQYFFINRTVHSVFRDWSKCVSLYSVNVHWLLLLCSLLRSPIQPIEVSCAGFVASDWYGNTAQPQCMLCINRLRASCWFDCMRQRSPNFYSLLLPLKRFMNFTPPSTRINSNKHIWQ